MKCKVVKTIEVKTLTKVPQWEYIGPNYVLKGDGFHLSYNETAYIFGANYRDETALIKDGNYYILNGDWREDYKKLLAQGFEACKKFFDKNNIGENASSWSTKL